MNPTRQRAIRIYYLYTILSNLLFISVFSVNMVYQAQTAHLSALQLVLVGTTLELSILLFEIPTGVVADLYSRRLSVIIGTLLIGVGFIVESQFPSFIPILLAQVLWGVGYTFTSGAFVAWITDEVGQETVQNLLLRGAQWEQIGAIIATIIAVLVADAGINLPILLAGIGFIMLGLALVRWMPETGFHPLPAEERQGWASMRETFSQGAALLKGSRLLVYLVLIAFFFGLYSEGFDRLWTPHFLIDLSFPVVMGRQPVFWFGMMTIAGSLLTLTMTEWIRVRLERSGSIILFGVLFGSTAVLTACLILFALADSVPLAVVVWIVIYVLRRAVSPALTIWYNERLDSRIRATMLSFTGQVDALGQVAGGPPIGWLGNKAGIPAALLVSALLLVPALAVFVPLLKEGNLKKLEGE